MTYQVKTNRSECVKVLGINIDGRLHFNQHMSYLRNEAARCIYKRTVTNIYVLNYTAKIL